jgi:hypothetical protein
MTIAKASTSKEATLKRIRTLTRVTDGIIPIPGTNRKVGVDPIIGLITGSGDSLGFIMSAYILLESLRFKLPKETLVRMLSNVAIDAVVGAVPFFGDIFDFIWPANSKNLKLLESHLENPLPQQAADRQFVLLILLGLAVILAFAFALAVLVASTIGWLWGLVFR